MIERFGSKGGLMHQAVEHNGVLYLSGVVAEDLSGGMTEQAGLVLRKIESVLEAHGSDKSKLLTATIYITDMALKEEMNAVWREWNNEADLPTRATVGVADLGPNVLIEIVVTAVRG